MVWVEFDKYINLKFEGTEIHFTEEEGSGVLEYLELLLPLYNVDYTAKHKWGSGRIKENEIIISILDYNDNLKDDIKNGAWV